MGLFRKATSMSTMGLVDFRSDKERVARNTGKTAKAIRAQTKQAARANRQQIRAMQQQQQQQQVYAVPAPQPFPPGWYPAPHDPAFQRWWDGYQWTQHTR